MLGRIKNIAIIYGLLHTITVEGSPERIGIGTMEFAKARQCLFTRCSGETYQQILLFYHFVANTQMLLQFGKDINHLCILITRVTTVNLINQECYTHLLQGVLRPIDSILHIQEFLDVYHNDTLLLSQCLDESVGIHSLNKHRFVDIHVSHHRIKLIP